MHQPSGLSLVVYVALPQTIFLALMRYSVQLAPLDYLYVLSSNMAASMHMCKMSACAYATMLSQLLFCNSYFIHSISQGIMDRNRKYDFVAHENIAPPYRSSLIQVQWGLLWNVRLFPPNCTAARNVSFFWYLIQTSFNTIVIPCLLVLFSCDVLAYCLNACLYAEIRWSFNLNLG